MSPIPYVGFIPVTGVVGLLLQIRTNATEGWSSNDADLTAILIVFAGAPALMYTSGATAGIVVFLAAGLTQSAMKIFLPRRRRSHANVIALYRIQASQGSGRYRR